MKSTSTGPEEIRRDGPQGFEGPQTPAEKEVMAGLGLDWLSPRELHAAYTTQAMRAARAEERAAAYTDALQRIAMQEVSSDRAVVTLAKCIEKARKVLSV